MFKGQVFQFKVLPFRMTLSLWIFTKLMDVITSHMRQRAIPVFPCLDDWLDLIRNQIISHTKYCLQTVQSLGFIPNLKKSDLIPAQKFMFIGMEFLTQQNTVRVPQYRVDSLFLTIKLFLSQTQVSAQTFLSLLGKLIAAADFFLLGRLHLRPLQLCVLSVWELHILPIDHYDKQHDSISLEMVNGHQSLCLGNVHSSSGTQCIPFHGCQSFWMGSSSGTDESIL